MVVPSTRNKSGFGAVKRTSSNNKSKLNNNNNNGPSTSLLMKCLQGALILVALLIIFSSYVIHSQTNQQAIHLEQQNQKAEQKLMGWSPIHMNQHANHNNNVPPLAPVPGGDASSQPKQQPPDEGSSLSSWLGVEKLVPLIPPLLSSSSSPSNIARSNGGSALEAFDLSVNQMQVIPFDTAVAPQPATPEDFLPTVVPDQIELRFRLRPIVQAPVAGVKDITAYQIVAQRAHHNNDILWDSGKVTVDTMPRSIAWPQGATLPLGTLVQWKVWVWDAQGRGPAESAPAKFGVGPRHGEWKGQWITHATDYATIQNTTRPVRRGRLDSILCTMWKRRRPLPLARASFSVNQQQQVASALLVVSGLGSFSVTLDGKTLSTSSVQDPPLTDYSQRVSYRGYDVTEFLKQDGQQQHVVGITLGSGWWDGLPINGKIVFQDLMPKGSITTIAQLHLTMTDGTTVVKIPTDATAHAEGEGWQVGKGHIIESNLYTGETINVGTLHDNQGWDTVDNKDAGSGKPFEISWEAPVLYKPGISAEVWHHKLQIYAYDHKTSDASNRAPIGKLVPIQMPPVMPVERIAPEEVTSLGDGRWLYDFGKGFSGVLRFEQGLPTPIVPKEYPRNHNVSDHGHVDFITVVYGDTIETTTGDINLVLVAGYGYHNGGWRRKAGVENPARMAGECWPKDHGKALTQRDVYILPKDKENLKSRSNAGEAFAKARQSRFTFHGFRYAEVCCTEQPPENVYAIKYRTKFPNWGEFDSSNPVLNGAYEMTRNSFDSNTLSVQSDCPHREKLQYGGDMVANSPAALHYFDVSAFYSKIVEDWTESQWDNGAYTTTSVFMDILRDMSIGQKGSGETVWAALPPVLTVRHMHNYGDIKLAERTIDNHIQWMDFLLENWAAGMERKYPGALQNYKGGGSGLGDWLAMMPRDSWLTHNAFYLASIRAVAYLANQLLQKLPDSDKKEQWQKALTKATEKNAEIETMIRSVYKGPLFSYGNRHLEGLGQNLGLFARIVNGTDRCSTLRSWLASSGGCRDRSWPGDEEAAFIRKLSAKDKEEMIAEGHLMNNRGTVKPKWYLRYSVNSGILDVKYTFKTLSDMGFHDIGLDKASGMYFPSYGYMMSYNATTLWETWWRSEDLYSRNHPMFGAIGEWLPGSVAGITLEPTTVGGEELIFWPRIPMNQRVVNYASALQGTKRGDSAIAWKFVTQGVNDTSATVLIRALVPPSTKANLRLPPKATKVNMRVAKEFPDLYTAKDKAYNQCQERRKTGQYGFPFFFHYDREKSEWSKVKKPSRTGTSCDSFLWYVGEDEVTWESYPYEPVALHETSTQSALQPGFFEIEISDWVFEAPLPDQPGYSDYKGDMGPYCTDPKDFVWDVNDALHMM